MFCNLLEHQSIQVCDAVRLAANHVIVVYRQNGSGCVERRVVEGPTVFVPQAEEWFVGTIISDWFYYYFKLVTVISDFF